MIFLNDHCNNPCRPVWGYCIYYWTDWHSLFGSPGIQTVSPFISNHSRVCVCVCVSVCVCVCVCAASKDTHIVHHWYHIAIFRPYGHMGIWPRMAKVWVSSETAIQDELNRQHVFEFCSPDVLDLIVQINMADDDTLTKLLELYQNCKSKGDRASLLLETNAGVSVGNGSSEQRRRRKPPSQIKRDNKRMDEFLAEKLEIRAAME